MATKGNNKESFSAFIATNPDCKLSGLKIAILT